jgi:hypothetical protein
MADAFPTIETPFPKAHADGFSVTLGFQQMGDNDVLSPMRVADFDWQLVTDAKLASTAATITVATAAQSASAATRSGVVEADHGWINVFIPGTADLTATQEPTTTAYRLRTIPKAGPATDFRTRLRFSTVST